MTAETRRALLDLPERFRAELEDLGAPGPGEGAVVAVSGGLDSLVLLHLLRFASPLPVTDLVAAHLDHRMRPESVEDAAWLRGLARAWRVETRIGRLGKAPADEAEARAARYDFLEEVRREEDAAWILTAHHADDQAETVLFRIVRGTGVRGLRGIPRRRDPGILRPLLPFRKGELRAYAEAVGIRPRFDETNLDRRFARNVLRHDVLPTLEAEVSPGARRALVRLARLAREEEAAWESLEPMLLDEIVLSRPGSGTGPGSGDVVLDRSAFLSHHPGVRARLLRRVLRGFDVHLDETGTRDALAFTSESASGRRRSLPGGLALARDFDHLVIGPARSSEGADEVLEIRRPAAGAAGFSVGGRSLRARWARPGSVEGGPSSAARPPLVESAVVQPAATRSEDAWTEEFSRSALLFPLRFRGWSPGDRIRLSFGSKKLKKLFGERRIPVRDRHRWPVMTDSAGRVLWVPGLARSTLAVPEEEEEEDDVLAIRITDIGED